MLDGHLVVYQSLFVPSGSAAMDPHRSHRCAEKPSDPFLQRQFGGPQAGSDQAVCCPIPADRHGED